MEDHDTLPCTCCQQVRCASEFAVRRHGARGRQAWCRSCMRVANAALYRRRASRREAIARCNRRRSLDNRARALAYLRTHPCVDCGEGDPIVLEFDHVEPATKTRSITSMLRGGAYAWRTILREIAKCEVRCANCHRRRTARQFGWGKLGQVGDGRRDDRRAGGGG